jgi:protein-S-isoprenylcysteine O-methyltransferase Ste14
MSDAKPISAARFVGPALYVTAWPALLFVLAGDARWTEGWLFTCWLIGLYTIITAWMYFKDPALLAERRRGSSRDASSVERTDRRLVLLLFVGFAAWIVLMPLDAKRFGWTPVFPLPLKMSGGGLLLLSSFFLFRSFFDNTFLSGLARVQSARKQQVVSNGVYAVVRHPMYLGIVLMFAGAPLLLGSTFGLLIAGAMTALFAFRIVREERLLADELDGYREYRQRVRYRLLPLIW